MGQILTRRNFLGGMVAAPAVVAAGSLMPVRLWKPADPIGYPIAYLVDARGNRIPEFAAQAPRVSRVFGSGAVVEYEDIRWESINWTGTVGALRLEFAAGLSADCRVGHGWPMTLRDGDTLTVSGPRLV